MAIDATHWTITRSTGIIDYTGPDQGIAAASYATVIEFHRWLSGLADDAISSGDDQLDATDILPSSRATDNLVTLIGGYTLTAAGAEHLYDGTIVEGSVGVDQKIWDGIVNYGNEGITIQIHQNGAVLADDYWNSIPDGETVPGLNRDNAQGISHRFLILVHDFVGDGGDINGRRLLGTTRTYGKNFGEFAINGTSRGNNVLALKDADDLNNATVIGTVATWNTIANVTEGYALLDVDIDTVNEAYYSEWNKDTYSINDFYERMKWLTRDGSASTLYGLNGELFRGITHEIDIDTPTGSFSAFEAVSWATGTAQMLAIDSVTAGTKMWIQLLTGVPPVDGEVITGVSTATATVNIAVVDRSSLIKTPFVGASTGSALIGSYGLSLETADLSATDKVFDLTNTLVTPPNNVTFTVSGLVLGEDYVLVGPWDGVATDANGDPEIDYNQMVTSGTLNTDNITSVVVSTAIPSDTPSTGFIRVVDDNGFLRKLHYSSWATSTFTIDTTDGQEDFLTINATTGNNVFISYLDKLAGGAGETFTFVYNADRQFVIKVRDGGGTPIKEYITSGTMGTNGGSTTAIRTTDA